MPLHLKTTIDIAATPEAIWRALTDLPAYADWNPFIREASGKIAVGERLDLRMQPEGGRSQRFRPRLKAVEPGRELRWLGRSGLPGIFDGEHRFTIEPTADGARLHHEERFTGLLVPLFARSLRARILPAFEQMNAALRARVA